MVSEEKCLKCSNDTSVVQKIRFDIYSDQRVELDEFLIKVEYSFCVVPSCDPNFDQLKQLARGINRRVKRNTFVDCARKTPEELAGRAKYYKGKRKS
jgi:hypothetical protein